MNTTWLILLGTAAALAAGEERDTPGACIARGMERFRENRVEESLEDFNRAAKLDPQVAPHLWQRGISCYYAGRFKEGREQFESHKAVNPHDVENAAWHFLCAARLENVEAARKAMLPIDTRRDVRVPMAEIYRLYAGRGSEDAVIAAADRAGTEQARMYAHLYLGLYREASGDEKAAREHLAKAAACRLDNHYMHEVAKVHLVRRRWKSGRP